MTKLITLLMATMLVACGSGGGDSKTASSANATSQVGIEIFDGCYDLSRAPIATATLTFSGSIEVSTTSGYIYKGDLIPDQITSPVNPALYYRETQQGDRTDLAISQTFGPRKMHSKVTLSAFTVSEIKRGSGLICANYIDTKPGSYIDRVIFKGTAGEGAIRLVDEKGQLVNASNGWIIEL